MERDHEFSTHVELFLNFTDRGTLLSNDGSNLVDVNTIKLGYPNAMVLIWVSPMYCVTNYHQFHGKPFSLLLVSMIKVLH